MKIEQLAIKGICFGEVLWDNLPTGKKLGGAPLNVAYHLNKLGIETRMLTRIGKDKNGDELIKLCRALGVPTKLFQVDEVHATSIVEVRIDEHKEVNYEIVYPVAWDYIQLQESDLEVIQKVDFMVFGSLSSRHEISYNTLKHLLKVSKYRVMDVNLRAPFYSEVRVLELLGYADLVKMNREELGIIAEWLKLPGSDSDSQLVEKLMQQYAIGEVIVTYGAAGAVYHAGQGSMRYHFPAYLVDVKDTIGSGDSFLAAFLSKRMRNSTEISIEETMSFAATLSAFVTQSIGACPNYDSGTINRFEWIQYLGR
ncbi:kinase, PfkB family [Sphingobacterium spiritivorum ATCC 33300]|uniref:Kinase, PfkB family n=1 Tax=Sphingobacterium spiritivorum ATCC 33300 TaxID=525372 RepID=C2FUK9_SPHSI|nr:carbohydrate kinase [Sphingobacterium spiritivorum]EEI93342.1 kinase, PfkB family [Sphingobacterium spiritivorum ATCC 33300]QQS95920.1 carbohydrate kinase [Sphingobacterium spiritivorum]